MTSSVTDLVNQGVQVAVNSLEELADRMTSDDFGFKEDDVANVDAVIEAIRDLEKERKRVHEELETETIKASIIRHRLQFLPAEIKNELQEAVNSARQSNAQALSELQEQLNKIRETIAYLQKQHEELEKENSILHPERELIRHQHEEIISKLNQRMAEKASMQITLNETRDMVRQANQSIVDLEDGILQLKEDLIQERTEARHEKKRLKKAVADTQEKTKEQKEQNHSKKKDLDKIQFELIESETKLQNIRKGIRRHDTSRQRLEAQERALRGQLSKVKRQNEELRMKGAAIVNDTLREEQIFQDKKHQMENKLRRFEEEAIKESKKQAEFDQKRWELERLYRDLITKLQDDREEVEAGNSELQSIKGKLTEKAEEVGQMQTDNIKMEESIEQLKEDHMAVIAQLKNQIEEYRDQLTRERKDRMELQQHKDDVGKKLDNVKGDNQKFMTDLNKRIQAGKTKHVELAREGTQLQAHLKEQDVELQDLESRLAVSRQGYETMYDALNAAVVHLEGNISGTQALLEAKVRELEEEGPRFKELEENFQQTTEEYDVKKKSIVSLKNKKSGLEDSIKRLKLDKDKMVAPIAELRSEVKKSKQELLGQMKNQGQNTSGVEQRIYVEGLKLRTVLEENMKFEGNCQTLERELSDLQEQLEANDKIKNSLNNEFMSVRGLLFNSWQDDSEMQSLFAARDKQMVEAFEDLLKQTLHREEKIEDVSKRLQGELEILAGFLENVSTRRPRAFGLPRSALGLSGKSTPSSLYTGDSQNSSRKASAKSSWAGSRRDAVEAVAAANQGSVSLAPSPSHHSTPGGTKTPRSTMLSARNQPSARSAARSRSAKSVTISTPNSPTKEAML